MAEMDRERLMEFIRLIVGSGQTPGAAMFQLNQLAEILDRQEDTRHLAGTVRTASQDYPEVAAAAKSAPLNAEALQIAHRRAEERRKREAEMADRC